MLSPTSNTRTKDILIFYTLPTPATKGISYIYNLVLTRPNQENVICDLLGNSSSNRHLSQLLVPSPCSPILFSRKILHWETVMKIFHQWYYTPTRLAPIPTSHSPKCWRNCNADGSTLHIWWDCPHIVPFWRSISNLLNDLTKVLCVLNPQSALSSWPPKVHAIVTHVQIAARLNIACSWKHLQRGIALMM